MALRQRSDLARRAERLIPGGVNSPVRAMRAVGLDEPVFVRSGSGSTIEDVNGKRYLDWVMSWGPLLFGHADEETLRPAEELGRGPQSQRASSLAQYETITSAPARLIAVSDSSAAACSSIHPAAPAAFTIAYSPETL